MQYAGRIGPAKLTRVLRSKKDPKLKNLVSFFSKKFGIDPLYDLHRFLFAVNMLDGCLLSAALGKMLVSSPASARNSFGPLVIIWVDWAPTLVLSTLGSKQPPTNILPNLRDS